MQVYQPKRLKKVTFKNQLLDLANKYVNTLIGIKIKKFELFLIDDLIHKINLNDHQIFYLIQC